VTTPWDAEPGPTPPSHDPTSAPGSASTVPPVPPRYETPDTTGTLPPIALPANTPATPAQPSYAPPSYAAPGDATGSPFGAPPPAGQFGSPPLGPALGPPAGSSWSGAGVPPTPPPSTPDDGPAKGRGRGWLVLTALLAAIALLAAGFVGGGLLADDDGSPAAIAGTNTASTAPANQNTTPLVQGSAEEPVVAVAKALSPAVVQIETQQGLGSGVIYDSTGLILTNEHVVASASSVTVNLSDGSKLAGTVVGADPSSDIAVVKVDPDGKTLTAAKLATEDPAVGSVAVAIGSPFGLSGTVTAGVISAVDRPVENGEQVAVNMIQTDAPINPGNSGGALANRSGEVIGINSEIYSQSGENNGIGFAIPIATAKTIADKITSGASLARASLGVSIQNPTDGSAGAMVVDVASGSGAENAGIQPGDEIVAIDGNQISDRSDLSAAIGAHQPGDTITVEVQRDGQTVELTATLGTAK
jgi:putative serine protease PepD